MAVDLLDIGVRLSAVALIFGAFILLLAGTTPAIGGSFRSAIEPLLHDIRERTTHTRAELADLTLKVAIGFAALAGLSGDVLAGIIICPLLWYARPLVGRLMREENKMLAIGGLFSIDLVIGFYIPMVAAQILLHNLFLAGCFLSVIVSMCWPAGGGSTVPGRSWKLAPVTT
jgi:hypothetical protein